MSIFQLLILAGDLGKAGAGGQQAGGGGADPSTPAYQLLQGTVPVRNKLKLETEINIFCNQFGGC